MDELSEPLLVEIGVELMEISRTGLKSWKKLHRLEAILRDEWVRLVLEFLLEVDVMLLEPFNSKIGGTGVMVSSFSYFSWLVTCWNL